MQSNREDKSREKKTIGAEGNPWDIRIANFGRVIEFVNPFRTASLSVTGTSCSLNCAHCGGRYLGHMLPPERWKELDRTVVRSCLVSGGCAPDGRVPVDDRLEEVRELSREFRLNMHLGLISEAEAERIAAFASMVSFDFVVDDETIREVYGLPGTGRDYITTYQMLRRYMRVIPHICIGLKGGKIAGEYAALEALRELGAEAVIFIVFIPTPGTRYAALPPPALKEVGDVLAHARELFPKTPIYLGCMRPRGAYRDELDCIAIDCGINRIVLPSRKAREHAGKRGLEVVWKDECCAF